MVNKIGGQEIKKISIYYTSYVNIIMTGSLNTIGDYGM